MKNEMKTSCDLISRADAIGAIASAEPKDNEYHYYKHIAIKILSEIPSIKVEPNWTCTANFVAGQLERLKDMTDEERLRLLHTLFPSAETHDKRTETHGVCSDLISREEVLRAIITAGEVEPDLGYTHLHDVIASLPSAEATKKKAELKENGDWDCPDVGCDECDHHRSVEWCSLAIPNHEKEIDETYKMVNEAFFEGFEFAENRYRLLIETVEELDKKNSRSRTG